jgi:hypothetical protein
MGHIIRTQAGTYRASWRDETGRQKAKPFRTKKEASGFLALVEWFVASLTRGRPAFTWGSMSTRMPRAASCTRTRPKSGAQAAMSSTRENASAMSRTHALPRWGGTGHWSAWLPVLACHGVSASGWAGPLSTWKVARSTCTRSWLRPPARARCAPIRNRGRGYVGCRCRVSRSTH